MRISFRANIPKNINPIYTTEKSKDNTVAILGSSKAAEDILSYMDICSSSAKAIILSGKNIVHGCGNQGIMGEAYKAGFEYSKKDENAKPIQNLAILSNPLWGDEDIEHCLPIVIAEDEADRIKKFAQVANAIVIFPGSAGTLQEATTLISKNYYGKPEEKKKIILVGSDFFKGLIKQYHKLYKTGLINCPPEKLFNIADSKEEVMKLLNRNTDSKNT